MKIYDCFPFFNELEILEIRLKLLYDHVDYFVISECDYTFSGLEKPFYFEENRERFDPYLDKIIHLKHYDTDKFLNLENKYTGKKGDVYSGIINRLNTIINTPQTDFGKPHWCRDFLHKELTMFGLENCDDDDIILFGDLDEIPNPDLIKFDNSYLLNQKNMMYNINIENKTEKWFGTYVCKYSNILENSLMFTRDKRFKFKIIDNAGWHLSFMGGSERIKQKIKSYSHQEFNTESCLNQIDNRLLNNQDILNRGINIQKIDINEYYPKLILDLVNEKFKYLING